MIIKTRSRRREEIRDRIVRMIQDAGMAPGQQLQSEKRLGTLLGVNHLTVRAALEGLADQGVVERRSGVGTFYTGHMPDEADDNYTANHTAESADPTPRPRPPQTVAAILLHAQKHYYDDLTHAIAEPLQRRGFLPVNFSLSAEQLDDEAESLAGLDRVFASRPDIFLALQAAVDKTPALVDRFNRGARSVPKVVRLLGNVCTDTPMVGHYVSYDHLGVMRAVVRRLRDLGHRRIAYLGGDVRDVAPTHRQNRKYAALFTEALIDEGLTDSIRVLAFPHRDGDDFRAALAGVMAEPSATRPTALLAIHDYAAVTAIDAARAAGLRVPEDLSVVGYYDTPWSAHYRMSTCRFPAASMAEAIDRLLSGAGTPEGTTLLPAEYVERETVAPAPN